jgi:glycosyltransferase involved in cell wall biosynthesis
MRVGLLHYSGPPTLGGVEQTLYFHSLALAGLGHRPRLLIGQGEPFDPRVEVRCLPRLFSADPQVLRIKAQLDAGEVSQDFRRLSQEIQAELRPQVADLQALIAHNVLTLHKNLALTSALYELHSQGHLPSLIGWHHDFAWEREAYLPELHAGEPWELLRRPWPGVIHVVVSSSSRERLAKLYGLPAESMRVIPPGIDPAVSGRWTSQTRDLDRQLDLQDSDLLLLLPARLTRRKNIEFALRVLAEIRRQSGQDARLLVTGPPGPHNPANQAYLEELLQLRRELGLERCAHFLVVDLPDRAAPLSDESLASLYLTCDALFFPSRDEGFGMPLLEAALARLPSFSSDIPPLRESGGDQVHYFSPDDFPSEVAAMVLRALAADPNHLRRRRALRSQTWERIVADRLLPLLEERPVG